MPRPFLRFGTFIALFSGGLAITETVPQPPFAKRIEHRDVRHGETVMRTRQVELTGGLLASPYISLAETVSVSKQDRAEFDSLLKRALAIDPDAKPQWRLTNIVMQRRARWLLSREDDLFLSDKPEAQNVAHN